MTAVPMNIVDHATTGVAQEIKTKARPTTEDKCWLGIIGLLNMILMVEIINSLAIIVGKLEWAGQLLLML
jgi:hypothetical protein